MERTVRHLVLLTALAELAIILYGIEQQKCRTGGTNMCVGLSAKVVKISDGTAVVDAGGAKREVSAQLLGDLEPGDYVMVHAGVAIAKITDDDEEETDQLMEELL